MRYRVIGDELTVLGFSLVGIEGVVVDDAESAANALAQAAADRDAGILLITERAAETIRERVDARLFADRYPLLLEIPDWRGPSTNVSMRELVQRAIGMAV